jgi:hypothetical protein
MSEKAPEPGQASGDAPALDVPADNRPDTHAPGRTESQPVELGPVEANPSPSDLPFGDDDERDDERPVERSRTRTIVLASLLAVGLAGAATLAVAGSRISSQKDASIATPDQVAGLQRNNATDALATAEYLRSALSAEVDLDEAVGAVYTDPAAADRSVLFFGGTTLIWTPGSDLDTAFNLVADDAGAVTDLHDVPAGDLGGTMKCGKTSSPDGDIAVCGWADHGSLALAMFPNRSVDDSAPLLRTIRHEIQTRG